MDDKVRKYASLFGDGFLHGVGLAADYITEIADHHEKTTGEDAKALIETAENIRRLGREVLLGFYKKRGFMNADSIN